MFIVFGVIDLIRQQRTYTKQLRMTKQEVKEEAKDMEGNPHVRGKIKRLRRDLARRRMMKAVPTATAVIVNPTHYAVALRYEHASMSTPVVVAKGKNLPGAAHPPDRHRKSGAAGGESAPRAGAVQIGRSRPRDSAGSVSRGRGSTGLYSQAHFRAPPVAAARVPQVTMDHTSIAIIGAGPTGIGAALRLLELGATDFVLIDAAPVPGGLASSCVDDHGFTWDLGGHVQFSHYRKFDEYMDLAFPPEGWLWHERESWIWLQNRFIPYPFQNNLHRLDPADRWRAIQGLMAATQRDRIPENFEQWILATFGNGIADLFMLPYNRKVWAHPLRHAWISAGSGNACRCHRSSRR